MMTIIDYGLGNIKAFANVYKSLGVPFVLAAKAGDLDRATKIILPGVGAFDQAVDLLRDSGMKERLDEIVIKEKVPVLGICVGMQMLASSSEEGELHGLGWINGTVKKIDSSSLTTRTRLPHMGWNSVEAVRQSRLFEGIDMGTRFYFLHSYYFHCHNSEDVVALTEYGGRFPSAVNSANVYGVQFHPEKSHRGGVRLLQNFASL